jgi:Protein of unknown function (DUF1501)
MDPIQSYLRSLTRRHFFGRSAVGIGTAALASLLGQDTFASTEETRNAVGGLSVLPHFPPKAKRVIYLFQAGAPSQADLFDHKPQLEKERGKDLPDSVRQGQRLTGMTSGQKKLPVAPTIFKFAPRGECGTWLSELLPHTANVIDELCLIRSVHTEAINHDPATTFIQTGSQIAGRPSMGAWVSYGLGSDSQNLPSFVVMVSRPSGPTNAQPLHERMWGAGFLPSRYQGVRFADGRDPVLFLTNPGGVSGARRRRMLDDLAQLNEFRHGEVQDPEITNRIAQYEMAYRMQSAVPELTDLSTEPESTFQFYGPESRKPGTFASNCILARRLAERGVRFIQLYHRGWDQHNDLPAGIRTQCFDTDVPSAALVRDLARRGLLDDTLVIWGGEFGRTIYSQGALTAKNYGRDHHPRCFSMWMAGGGIKKGLALGRTDDFSYNIVDDPVHVHDLNATILNRLGIDHTRLIFKHQGRLYRLTDVQGQVVEKILA